MARRFVLKADPEAPASEFTIDYRSELNEQQLSAVTAPDGPVLVVAGAGTGKTRTLIYRLAYLIESGVRPENIVLLTFTRKAAREMLTRASSVLDGRCERVKGGTFHGYCLATLKRYASKIGFPEQFTVLDTADSADVIRVLRTSMGLEKSEKRFPKNRTIQSILSAVVNRGLSLPDVLEQSYPQFLPHIDKLTEMSASFRTYKRIHGLMDYDDLMLLTSELFRTHPDILRTVSGSCKHVLVDEYQDTNKIQADLVRALSSVHGNVMAVGDDAQSIYGFRGADYSNIFRFPEEFADTKVLKLEENYRSTQPILDLANHVLDRATRRYEKQLFTRRDGGELPGFVQAADDRFESRFICQMVLQLREEGVPLNRMAVLFRNSNNSYDLEIELDQRKIPYVKFGGLKLTDTAHIRDVVAHIKVLENPRDAVSWNRILLLMEGVGPKTVQELLTGLAEAEDPVRHMLQSSGGNRPAKSLDKLYEVMSGLSGSGLSLSEQVDAVVKYYQPILSRRHIEDAEKREQDLDRFIGLMPNFSSRANLLSSLALDPIELTVVDTEATVQDESPLVLSTIHSAKGLEFHSVFLLQALDGILPSSYSIDDEEQMDEELRLLYVALTRAEENLFVSYPVIQERRARGEFFTKPTRFLNEMPENILEPWILTEERPALEAGETTPLLESGPDGEGE